MHSPAVEGNFCDEHGKAIKLATIQDYNRHMGYVDKSDLMVNTYSISRRTWKQQSYSSILCTLPFSTALSFLPPVVQNYHTHNSD